MQNIYKLFTWHCKSENRCQYIHQYQSIKQGERRENAWDKYFWSVMQMSCIYEYIRIALAACNTRMYKWECVRIYNPVLGDHRTYKHNWCETNLGSLTLKLRPWFYLHYKQIHFPVPRLRSGLIARRNSPVWGWWMQTPLCIEIDTEGTLVDIHILWNSGKLGRPFKGLSLCGLSGSNFGSRPATQRETKWGSNR